MAPKLTKEDDTKFTVEHIVSSKTFRFKKDALLAILEQDKQYTKKEVEEALEAFYKGGTE